MIVQKLPGHSDESQPSLNQSWLFCTGGVQLYSKSGEFILTTWSGNYL